jgi:hypothetical protein
MPEMRASPVRGFSCAAGEARGEAAGVEIVQEAAVIVAVDAEPGRHGVVKRPADVVVHADVVDPGAARVDREPLAHGRFEQADLARGE